MSNQIRDRKCSKRVLDVNVMGSMARNQLPTTHFVITESTTALSNIGNKRSFSETKARRQKVIEGRVSKETSDLQKSRNRWYRDTDIISRIDQLGKQLGHVPTLLDLYCSFRREEIDAIRDYLPWLLIETESGSTAIDEADEFETSLIHQKSLSNRLTISAQSDQSALSALQGGIND
jgi:hypothetical protein